MAEVAQLIAKRNNVKGRLDGIADAVREFKEGDNVYQLKTRIPYLESLLNEFNAIQFEIVSRDPAATTQADQKAFEKQYFDTFSEIHLKLERCASSAQGSVGTNASTTSRPDSLFNIKLPTLSLPAFSGAYSEWNSFYDTFNSLIHLNDRLNDCERFHYLKACLKNEPLHAVESLPVSQANYASAWDILRKRYENKRLIVQEHVQTIIESPNISKASHTALRQLIDKVTSNLEALRVLKLPVDSWDAIIVPIITNKLDYVTKKEWQATLDAEIPKLADLTKFLDKRLEILGSIDAGVKTHQMPNKGFPTNKPNYQSNATRQVSYVTTKKRFNCIQCKKSSHNLYQCIHFLKLSVPDRIKQVENNNLCKNCLKHNHSTVECQSPRICNECKQKHNSLLHQFSEITQEINAPSASTSEATVANNCTFKTNDTVLLSTALIGIKDNKGCLQEGRALLDVGSQSCFITSFMCNKLGLKTENVNIPIAGINQNYNSVVTRSAKVIIKSRYNAFSASMQCLVIPKITENLPVQSFSMGCIDVPTNIKLADPKFNESGKIDVLIGAELFWKLLCIGQIQTSRDQPVFQKTHLGWLIGGAVNLSATLQSSVCNLNVNPLKNLDDRISKFWELEYYPSERTLSSEEKKCETHFQETTTRSDDGRFVVKLPLKEDTINLGTSYEIALRRFYSLEKRLNKYPELKKQYSDFIQEYQNLNHMELVKETDPEAPCCYLPHHAVFKESSTTTKLRVVFDASSKTTNGLSLNDNLICGPVIQQDLFSILTRFRTYQYVLNGDISKMYRQIKIHGSQVDYQRIMWRKKPDENIQIFRLLTLTYGTKTASFLATRCLQELAEQTKQKFPRTSEIIATCFYMDDLLTGANSIQELINIRNEITTILASAGFELRKFSANHIDILPQVTADRPDALVNLDKNGETKTLGLLWNCTYDLLKYQVKIDTLPKKVTKRSILSVVAQIFDPLGLVGPVTMRAKIILQHLWTLKLSWDESVPMTVYSAWIEFVNQLQYLNDLRIERKVTAIFPSVSIELHGFSDASQTGYGACIYVRCTDNNKNHSAHLLCAKSRVAPLKTVSIPRLELCAALLLAKLMNSVNVTLNLKITKYFLWTDSTIVLAWLASSPNTLNTFVANRVTEIQTVTDVNNWHHVRSEDNPADIISRGQLPEKLLSSQLWWYGPSWLSQAQSEMPQSNLELSKIEIFEKRKVALLVNRLPDNELALLTNYAKFSKLQRVTAYCLRFVKNCKNGNSLGNSRVSGNLSILELRDATRKIIKMVQEREFSLELKELRNDKGVNKQSSLLTLNPFIDEHGLIRVGGRLRNAPISSDRKFPLILPKKHHITKLIILQNHEYQLHAGAQATLASLRQNYWIVDARSIIRLVLNKCVKCFRANPHPVEQKMGDLPKDRLELTRPFLKTGIDYAGPISIKEGRGRGKRTVKAYMALFVCFATKAVHLELVGDLTTESFLNALKRFMARRGCVSHLYSDNATNFVGAKRELKELAKFLKDANVQSKLHEALAPMNIVWKFIPPRSPNMGGLWEVNVKSVKFHLKRVLGDALLTYEEMYTLLTRIESCINSRPLTPLTSDPNDLVALTPGHFLIGQPLTAPVEGDITELKTNRLSRWQHVEQARQHFWKRWQREYLLQMQQRIKWHQEGQQHLRVGDLVVITEDGTPPQQWLLGRVVELHPGADGVVRVATAKTVRGVLKRSVRRMCPLPIKNDT